MLEGELGSLGVSVRVLKVQQLGDALEKDRGLFTCSARFGKNDGDFLAAAAPQPPPKRPFDRPVRWYLRYLRARDVQSATLPRVYVTSGGSDLLAAYKIASLSSRCHHGAVHKRDDRLSFTNSSF